MGELVLLLFTQQEKQQADRRDAFLESDIREDGGGKYCFDPGSLFLPER
jgi:hypothetical protein